MNETSTKSAGQLENWLRLNAQPLRWLMLTFGVLQVFAYYLPGLLNQAIFSNDMAQWTAWAYRYQDAELFVGDPNAAYWTANFPIGYHALLRFLAPLFDPQLIGETVGLALGGLATWLSFQLGRQVCGGRLTGGLAALLLVFIGQFTHFQALNLLTFEAGGLPRGFAFPLLLLGYLGIVQDRSWQFSGAVILAALFYPPMVVSLGAIVGLLTLARVATDRTITVQAVWPLLVIAASLAIAQANVLGQGPMLGSQFSLRQIIQMPEFHDGGILPLFYANPWNYLGNAVMFDKGPAGIAWLAVMAVVLAVIYARRDCAIGRRHIFVIPLAALANYALAYILLPRMYEPSRYLIFSYMLLTLIGFTYVFDAVARWLGQRIAAARFARLRKWQIALGVTLAVALPLGNFAARAALDRGGMSDPMPAEMYDFIAKLPKHAVIAGMPTLTDRIPMRAQRSVLVMSTSFYPYHAKFYETNLAKFDALTRALSAPDAAAVMALRDRFGVQYL